MPEKKYIVTLTKEERTTLNGMLNKGKHSAGKRKRAQALLLAEKNYTDDMIADRTGLSRRGLEQLRQRFFRLVRGTIQRLPFLFFKKYRARFFRLYTGDICQIHNTNRYDRIHQHQHCCLIYTPFLKLFHRAAGLQHEMKPLYLPPLRIILNPFIGRLNRFHRLVGH